MTGQHSAPRSESLGAPADEFPLVKPERTTTPAGLGSSGTADRWLCPGCPWLGDDDGSFACEPRRGMSEETWNSQVVFPIFMYEMSRPCGRCGQKFGTINRKNGQDVVTCEECGRFVYNAPRSETGLPA